MPSGLPGGVGEGWIKFRQNWEENLSLTSGALEAAAQSGVSSH